MKKITFLLLAALPFLGLKAQENSPAKTKATITKIYFQAGAGGSSRDGIQGEMSFQAVINDKWSATVSSHDFTMKAKNLPSDYEAGWGFVLFIPLTDDSDRVKMSLYSITAGKYFPVGRNAWFTTEAGISIVNGDKSSFKRNPDTAPVGFLIAAYYPSNYITTKEKKTTVGGMLRADFNWAVSKFFGMGGGVFANFNSIQSPVGYQVKLIIGRMNRGKK